VRIAVINEGPRFTVAYCTEDLMHGMRTDCNRSRWRRCGRTLVAQSDVLRVFRCELMTGHRSLYERTALGVCQTRQTFNARAIRMIVPAGSIEVVLALLPVLMTKGRNEGITLVHWTVSPSPSPGQCVKLDIIAQEISVFFEVRWAVRFVDSAAVLFDFTRPATPSSDSIRTLDRSGMARNKAA
jgi:hypothetical protein